MDTNYVFAINGDRYIWEDEGYTELFTKELYDTYKYDNITDLIIYSQGELGFERPVILESENILFNGSVYSNPDVSYIFVGKENRNTFVSIGENASWSGKGTICLYGNVCFWIDNSLNNKEIFGGRDYIGNIRLVVKNGSIPTGSNIVVEYTGSNFILDNPLYNQQEAFVGGTVYGTTITPKSSAQIMSAGFTQDQAERLTEIMQVPHGQDETGDEIVKLAQMGDIEGAKELLGGGEPPIKQRFVYFNGKQVIPMINNGGQ